MDLVLPIQECIIIPLGVGETLDEKLGICTVLLRGNLGLSALVTGFLANYSPEPKTEPSGGQGNLVTCVVPAPVRTIRKTL